MPSSPTSEEAITASEVRTVWELFLRPDRTGSEICEFCKQPVRVMCQKGTGVCSQKCARLASHILFSDKEKAEKFGGGYAGD